MKLMRRRDVDRIDGRIITKPANVRIDIRPEVPHERQAWPVLGFRRCRKMEPRVTGRGPHHDGACHAEAHDAETDWFAFGHQSGSPLRLAASIAAQMRAGVAGMSRCSMPYTDKASTTAFMITAMAGVMPASPPPLTRSGLPLVGSSASSTLKLGTLSARDTA